MNSIIRALYSLNNTVSKNKITSGNSSRITPLSFAAADILIGAEQYLAGSKAPLNQNLSALQMTSFLFMRVCKITWDQHQQHKKGLLSIGRNPPFLNWWLIFPQFIQRTMKHYTDGIRRGLLFTAGGSDQTTHPVCGFTFRTEASLCLWGARLHMHPGARNSKEHDSRESAEREAFGKQNALKRHVSLFDYFSFIYS